MGKKKNHLMKKVMNKYLEDLEISFPRMISFPFQEPTTNIHHFLSKVIKFAGERPCFMSLNGFPTMRQFFKKKWSYYKPTTLRLERILFDLDDENDIKNTQKDTQKIVKFCEENEIKYFVQFTSGKGFHVFIEFNPVVYKFIDESRRMLKRNVKAFQLWLKEELDLKTFDESVLGVPEKMVRIPSSPYVSVKERESNGLICTPLNEEQLFSLDMNEIKELSKDYFYQKTIEKSDVDYTLKTLINRYEISFDKIIEKYEITDTIAVKFDDLLLKYVKELCEPRVCIFNELVKSDAPSHFARLSFCLLCKDKMLSKNDIEKVWLELGQKMNYDDIDYEVKRKYQINHIYDNYDRPPGCDKIKSHGLCIGGMCPLYKSD